MINLIPSDFKEALESINQLFGTDSFPQNDYLTIPSIPDHNSADRNVVMVSRLSQLINLIIAHHYGYIKIDENKFRGQNQFQRVFFTKRYLKNYEKLLQDAIEMHPVEFFKTYVLGESSLPKRCQNQSPRDIISLLRQEAGEIPSRLIT